MSEQLSFIETQFPVSKVSKESYKERKAGATQTLTGIGKWWGRKPLIVVRAALLGCLLPISNDPKKDTDIFFKILSMDQDGLLRRKEKKISTKEMYEVVSLSPRLSKKYLQWFDESDGRISIKKGAPKEEIEIEVFNTFGYDKKLNYCIRPEQLDNISVDAWSDINSHLGTSANNLPELISQLSQMKYGHTAVVGDCFCGGGSIPFEAAKIGCDVYGSDLNPIAGMLTWADLNLIGNKPNEINYIQDFQKKVYEAVEKKIEDLGIERNDNGDRAFAYLYCHEVICPECGVKVPLAPSWIIGKGTKTVAKLKRNKDGYDFDVKMNASASEMKEAETGTIVDNSLVCPACGMSTPISTLRHDKLDDKGNVLYGLRKWEKHEFEAEPDDVYHERLYAIKYESPSGNRYYTAPGKRDLLNEEKIRDIVSKNICQWQQNGFIPSSEIEPGYNTDQLIRERGWKYWHQLFNARQLLILAMLEEEVLKESDPKLIVAGTLGVNRCLNYNSKLSRWLSNADTEHGKDTFYNQAFNTLQNYSTRAFFDLKDTFSIDFSKGSSACADYSEVLLVDARQESKVCDIWITDPPYADAVNYHELSEFFLAWDKTLIQKAFPEWYTDSKRILAVKGDDHFSKTMIEIYSNLTKHMNEDGMQVVMFTHSDPAVWAQLAIIMWRAGLKVTSAWNIATETDASGLKSGNYVKGTVLLVLRKQAGSDTAFLDEINVDIRSEVKRQIASMQDLDDKEEPNFSDPDYVLAAYAASLKVLTSYAEIEDLDLDYELNQAISNPSCSKIVGIIENAKKVAYDCVIPLEFDSFLWRDLTNAEKLYIKGIESEKHGNYQIGTYQEFARGFSIAGYSQLMASERANTARLKTPFEMAGRTINDVPDFESSLMRSIFQSIYTGIKEEMNPNKALGFLKNDIQDYWDKREMIKQILSFLVDIKDITNMQPHWTESAEMADQLLALVTHDSI